MKKRDTPPPDAWPFATQVFVVADAFYLFEKKIKRMMEDGYTIAPGTVQRVEISKHSERYCCAMIVPNWKAIAKPAAT